MKFDQLLKDYHQTKAHLHSAVMGAAGWESRNVAGALVGEPSVFVYLFDKPTGFIWMAQMVRDTFVEVSTNTHRDAKLKRALSDGLAQMLHDAATGHPPAPIDGLDWEQMLSLMLAGYAGTTSAWKIGNGMRDGGHFVVINYRKSASTKDSLLRPFALTNTDDQPLSAIELQGYLAQVMQMDRAKHPEWFR